MEISAITASIPPVPPAISPFLFGRDRQMNEEGFDALFSSTLQCCAPPLPSSPVLLHHFSFRYCQLFFPRRSRGRTVSVFAHFHVRLPLGHPLSVFTTPFRFLLSVDPSSAPSWFLPCSVRDSDTPEPRSMDLPLPCNFPPFS